MLLYVNAIISFKILFLIVSSCLMQKNIKISVGLCKTILEASTDNRTRNSKEKTFSKLDKERHDGLVRLNFKSYCFSKLNHPFGYTTREKDSLK